MLAKRAFVFLVVLLLYKLPLLANPALTPAELHNLFQQANKYFNLAHPTPSTDAKALDLYEQVIDAAESTRSTEAILFQSYINKGVLLDVRGSYPEALTAYQGALRCKARHADWSDSLLFKVYIYAGPDYYQLEILDSAYDMLNRAERLADKFPGLADRERLYNSLGALYFESGNYIQSKDYFARALDIVRKQRPDDVISTANFQNNIASCLYKLGEYRQSLNIYTDLVQSGHFSDKIYFNVGRSYVAIGNYPEAMTNYRKVNPASIPGVLNEMAYAQYLQKKTDSALYFLDAWRSTVDSSQQTRIDGGINDLYRTQVLMAQGQSSKAIGFLQQAIITFSGRFKNADIQTNPTDFVGSFASYRLFDALAYKAQLLGTLYHQNGKEQYLEESIRAYNSAIDLFRYIEKTYTTDDAKLFLKKNNRTLYEQAVLAYLDLNRLHPGGPYLEEAFITAEKSKSSIVTGRLSELALGKMPGIDPKILRKQQEVKYNIARLELKSDAGHQSQDLLSVASKKADYEIELSLLQKSLEMNSGYYKMKFGDSCPTVRVLQSGLRANQAIVSLFVSEIGLHIFTITSSSFNYLLIDSSTGLSGLVKGWIDILNNTVRGQRFRGQALASQLYKQLVQPLQTALAGKDEWIIIPDGIYYLLPFESLPMDEYNHPLIETTTISYQLSAKFLAEPFAHTGKKASAYSVLAFAPFAAKAQWVNAPGQRYLDQLPNSGTEIANLPGELFINEQATKDHFLSAVNHYPVVHLATHAFADPVNEKGSLICFYPEHRDAGEDCLFLPELYGLTLDSTNLVILSACESGRGEIVDNEGMMSLSRGFMYAGCASTVNSLWKADDESTASILRQFHVYLERGYTKAAALRQAKLDYLHSGAVYITPNFWAHLILIGNTEAIVEKGERSWIAACVLGLGFIAVLLIWRARSSYRHRSTP